MRCEVPELELIIQFDGTLSLNSQLLQEGAPEPALPIIDFVAGFPGVRRLKLEFSLFGDRNARAQLYNKWLFPVPTPACHMPVVELTEDVRAARARVDNVLRRFVPVPGGLDDPAEDSLGSLYKTLSNIQYRSRATPAWTDPVPAGDKLRVILTITDARAHYAEDGSRTNQGYLPFPPIPDFADAPLVCDARYSYVPLNLVAGKLQHLDGVATHLVTFTTPAAASWWDWLHRQLGVAPNTVVTAQSAKTAIQDLICGFAAERSPGAAWAAPSALRREPAAPWVIASGADTPTNAPSGFIRALMVLLISAVFFIGWCVAWIFKKAAALSPAVVPTVSMAPADSAVPSERREELASVSSGQFVN